MPTKKKKERKKPKTKLTIMQSRLVGQMLESRTQREAAILAGYKDSPYIKQTAHKALVAIRRKMPDLLEEMGITPETVVYRKLLPLMDAKTVKFLKGDTEFVELDDNATQIKALHIYFLLTGAYAPKEQITQQATTVRAIILDAPRPRPQLPPAKPSGNGSN